MKKSPKEVYAEIEKETAKGIKHIHIPNPTPSDVCKEAMDIVSKDVRDPEIKYSKVSFTLNLEEEYSLEDLKRNAKGIIDRAIKFVENGYSCDGLEFKFTNIKEHGAKPVFKRASEEEILQEAIYVATTATRNPTDEAIKQATDSIKDDVFKPKILRDMKTLEQEAQEYLVKNYQKGSYLGNLFIAGANSNYVKRKIIKDQIKIFKKQLSFIKKCDNYIFHIEKFLRKDLKELQQQLKELE